MEISSTWLFKIDQFIQVDFQTIQAPSVKSYIFVMNNSQVCQ